MMGAAATQKKRGVPININFLHEFVHSSPDPDPRDVVVFASTPPSAARKAQAKGNARARSSPDSPDVRIVSPPSAPAKGRGKRRRDEGAAWGGEYSGRQNDGLRLEIEMMSDAELRLEIEMMSDAELQRQTEELHPSFGGLLAEGSKRMLPLLEDEARRRGIRTGPAQDGDVARSMDASVFNFGIEDMQTEDDSHKYVSKSSTIRSTKNNYGSLGVQTRRSSNQTGQRKPIPVDKMYTSRTSPSGRTQRVRANHPKEHDNAKSRHTYQNYAKRRKEHHEDSSLLHQKVKDVVLLDDEDVQPYEPVDCVVPEKWKEVKIYYPSSDNPEAVELSSSDIRCLNPGVYLSSPVINYYIQYIKRDEMHIEYGTEKFYMFNTYFYSKLQDALLDKVKFLKLRRWWKGVNIFQRGYIILPIHGTSHWSLIIVCMPAKESNSGPIILHLDSLGMHPSAEIFDTVGRYLEEEWRHLRKNPPSDISISDTLWQDLPMNIQKEKLDVPAQNNAYDCGIFMLFYIQRFIGLAPERFTRDSLDMFGRSWFRSEETSSLRNKIQGQLMKLFADAVVENVMPEAAAPDGSDEECIIKEGEPEAVVTPCGSSGMPVGGGDVTHDEEDLMEIRSLGGTASTTYRSDGMIRDCALSEVATSGMPVGGGDATHAEEDLMQIRSLGGTACTTRRSDGMIRDCALSESATSGMPVGGGDATHDEEDLMEIRSLGGTASTTRRSDGMIRDCALSEGAMFSDTMEGDGTMNIDCGSSKTEQDIEIFSPDRPKHNEEVVIIQSTPDPTMYCSDSCDSDVEEVKTPEVEKRRRRYKSKFCNIS